MHQAQYSSYAANAVEDLTIHETITCGVEFGVPCADGSCIQVGICRIIPDVIPQSAVQFSFNRRCQFATAEIGLHHEGGSGWRFYFSCCSLKPCTERAIFKNRYFPVPVDFVMPDALMSQFGGDAAAIIRAGKYPIRAVNGGYEIIF